MVRMATLLLLVLSASVAGAQAPYFPDRFDWQRRAAGQSGMDAAALDAAVKFAVANENQAPRDLALAHAASLGAEPFDTPIGPHKPRSGANGLVIYRGAVVAEWGDTRAVDMTFSVTKTFLSSVAGVAWQKGLIRDVTDRAAEYMPPGVDLFDDQHNQPITWEHLLRQTSDWKGTLWGKPDWADRPEGRPEQWPNRTLHAPGTHYKYNDVRVNVLALALLHVAMARL
jgi:CubicO group peptidase (beta-lactamase class C family)